MKYFIELLESYSKLKKRQLRLIAENSDQAQQDGDMAIQETSQAIPDPQNPQLQVSKYTKESPYLPTSVTPIKMWRSKNGAIYWAGADAPVAFRGYSVNSDIDRFYGNFKQKEASVEGEEKASQPAAQDPNQPMLAMPQIFPLWKGADLINKLFPGNKISNFVKKLLQGKNLTNEEIIKEAEGLRSQLKDGKHNGSWAKALFNAYKKIVHEDGTFRDYDLSEDQDDIDLKLEVQDRIVRAVDLVSKEDNLTDEECNELKRSVVILSRGRIAIKQPLEYGGRGLIFNDKSKRLNLLLAQGARNKGCELEKKSLGELGSTTADAARVRGDFMESLEEIVHTIKNCHIQLADPKSKNRRECMGRAEASIAQWKSERDKLNLYFAGLEKIENTEQGEYSVPMELAEELEVLNAVKQILGDNAPEILVKRLTAFAMREHRIRTPDFLIRVNKETGEGKRADTIELYDSREKAVEALVRQGFDEAQANELVSETDLSVMCSDENYAGQCPQDTKRPYYRVSVSLKNYLNLANGIHLGGRSEEQISAFLTGEDCKVKNCSKEQLQASKRLRESMAKTLGQDWMNNPESPEYKNMLKVHEEMESIKNSVGRLGKKTTKTSDGKELDIDTLKQYGETLKEGLKNNKTYGEYVTNELPTLIDEYIEEGKNPEEIKARIVSYLQNKRLEKMANRSGDAGMTARAYLCSKKFLSGASSDKSITSVRSLERMESFILSQNDVYSGLSDYIANGKKSSWKLDMSNSTITVRNEKTKARVTTSIDIGKNGKIDYGARTNAPMLESLSKKSLVENTDAITDYTFNLERPSDMFLNFFNKFIKFEI